MGPRHVQAYLSTLLVVTHAIPFQAMTRLRWRQCLYTHALATPFPLNHVVSTNLRFVAYSPRTGADGRAFLLLTDHTVFRVLVFWQDVRFHYPSYSAVLRDMLYPFPYSRGVRPQARHRLLSL